MDDIVKLLHGHGNLTSWAHQVVSLFGLCSQFLPVIDLPSCRVKFIERMRRQSGPFSVCILDVDIPMGGVAWEEIREKQRAMGGDNFAWFTLMPVSLFSVTTSKGTSSLVDQDFFLCLYKAACIAWSERHALFFLPPPAEGLGHRWHCY